ncbi:MAG TPA: hypothetical protein VFB06_16215 [Streptosporangiaceae bacterium]|nr:hypothetical protein [Streptosporangiaceae bacterium]
MTGGRAPANLLPLGADGRPLSRRGSFGSRPRRRQPPRWFPGRPAEQQSAGGTIREHQVFCAVLLVATVVRVIAMLGFAPALWYPDSLPYVHAALYVAPYRIRPVGYSFMLWALRPLHSFTLVVLVQHAMGLAAGTAIYLLLRRRFQMPGWAATLTAIPPLLSAYTIQIEHFVLSDTLFGFLGTMAVVLMLWRPVPPVWICALAGLLLSGAAVVRSEGLPLMVPFCLFLVPRLRGIRIIAGFLAMCVTFAIPVLSYEQWFDRDGGTFAETSSTGAFLYGRVSTFADCSIIKPPADEQWLCLTLPPGKRVQSPDYYVWGTNSPIKHGPGPEFGNEVDRMATDFDRRAIMAQPLDYLKAVLYSSFLSFRSSPTQTQYLFPADTPKSLQAVAASNDENVGDADTYGRADPSTRIVTPFAQIARGYQRFAVVPGWLLGFIALTGLAGMAAAWRRLGGAASLPWLTGFVLLVSPAATAGFSARYVVACVPVFCVAAGLGAKQLADHRVRPGRLALEQPPRDAACRIGPQQRVPAGDAWQAGRRLAEARSQNQQPRPVSGQHLDRARARHPDPAERSVR